MAIGAPRESGSGSTPVVSPEPGAAPHPDDPAGAVSVAPSSSPSPSPSPSSVAVPGMSPAVVGNGATGPASREQPRVPAPATAAARPPVRRVRHKLRRIDLWSVLKISLCFYTAAMLIMLLTGVVLWWIADAAGIRAKVEKNIASLFSAPDYRIVPGLVLEGAALIGLVIVALLVILTVVGAALYNVFSDLFGGVEFTTIEEEAPARRRSS